MRRASIRPNYIVTPALIRGLALQLGGSATAAARDGGGIYRSADGGANWGRYYILGAVNGVKQFITPIAVWMAAAYRLLVALVAGACLVTLPTFEAEAALRMMAQERCTLTSGNDTLFQLMMGHPSFDPALLCLRGGWAAHRLGRCSFSPGKGEMPGDSLEKAHSTVAWSQS